MVNRCFQILVLFLCTIHFNCYANISNKQGVAPNNSEIDLRTTPVTTYKIGDFNLAYYLGDILDHANGAIVTSHPPNEVSRFQISNSLINSLGNSIFDPIKMALNTMKNLPFASVYPYVQSSDHENEVRVYNIIIDNPTERVKFYSLEELNKNIDLIPPGFRDEYRKFIEENIDTLKLLDPNKEKEKINLTHLQALRNARVKFELDDLVKPIEMPIQFDIIIEAVINVLEQAAKDGVRSIAFPAFGANYFTDFTEKLSLAAIATAILLYQKRIATEQTQGVNSQIPEIKFISFSKEKSARSSDISEIKSNMNQFFNEAHFLHIAGYTSTAYSNEISDLISELYGIRNIKNDLNATKSNNIKMNCSRVFAE